MNRKRTSSTIPFGYELSDENPSELIAIPALLVALKESKDLVEMGISLREASTWLQYQTGRRLSHAGLKKIIDNG